MAKYHINKSDGNIGLCRAENDRCPFGSADEHYTSMVAAAHAYERSMEDQSLSSVKKPKTEQKSATVAYGLVLTRPDNSGFSLESLPAWEASAVKGLQPESQRFYSEIREAVPALIHTDAHGLITSWESTKSNASAPDWSEFYEARVNHDASNTYDILRSYVAQGPLGKYSSYRSEAELEKELVNDTARAITISRPYGFPEDEMSRSYMDQRERELIATTARYSGESPREIKARVLESVPLEREFQKSSQAELEGRIEHIKSLTRVTAAKKSTLASAERELALRKLEAAKEKAEAYSLARDAIRDGKISKADVYGIVGYPRDADLEKIPADERSFWSW